MEDLILPATNSKEENILAIIEFIKQVEREHGLSDDEIVYKYTCGNCMALAARILHTLRDVFKQPFNELDYFGITSNDESVIYHEYLKLKGKTEKENLYFDILGRKTKSEVVKFMQSNFWEDIKSKDWSGVEKHKLFWDTDYIFGACKHHIKTGALTINI